MEAMDKLTEHLKTRLMELRKKREEGVKIVGYAPGGFMPEELLYACGAMPVPVGLIRGGEHEAVIASGAHLPRFLDTFCRAQIGYRELKEETLYQMIDLLVVPITDNNIRAIADTWDFYTNVEVFRYGVPHTKTDHAFKYYRDGLNLLKEKLEELTGTKITDEKLREAINISNRERELLKEISLMRKSERPPISGGEFAKLNHASFIADKHLMIEVLESLCEELKKKENPPSKGPRILLTGSTLAVGDSKVIDLVEETDAAIVVEEFCEGIRHYWEKVEPNGDLIEALADRYFRRRVPCAFFRPAARERFDFIVKLAKEFRVDGVLWYQLMYRDSYDIESFYFPEVLKKELGLSMLKVESDYDVGERGPFRTRIETFVETIRR